MANFLFSLDAKTKGDITRKQIMVRVDISSNARPRFKTGIYVNPSLFSIKDGVVNKPRASYIKGSKVAVNQSEIDEAERANTQLQVFKSRVNDIILQSKGYVKPENMKDWILRVLAIKNLSTISPFTYDNIVAAMNAEKAAAEAEERAKRIKSIYDYIIEYCDTPHRYSNGFVKKISPNRTLIYYALGRILARYEYFKQQTENKDFTLYVPNITSKVIEDFIEYCRNEGDLALKYESIFEDIREKTKDVMNDGFMDRYNKKPMNRNSSSITLYYSILNTLFKWIIEEKDVISHNPCKNARIETPKEYDEEIHYLSIEQRDRLANAPLSNKARELTRDIFVFACHTGCRISDIQNLTVKNIKTVDNYTVLIYEPIKTSHNRKQKLTKVVLFPKPLELIAKYKGLDPNGYLFPCITTSAYNRMIKKIFKEAGLTEMVETTDKETGETVSTPLYELASSHLARKTFTQNLYLATYDVQMVKSAAGHSDNSKVTETTYIANTVGMQAEAIRRMNQTANTSTEEEA